MYQLDEANSDYWAGNMRGASIVWNIGRILQANSVRLIWQCSVILEGVRQKNHAGCLHFSVRGYYKSHSYLVNIRLVFNF